MDESGTHNKNDFDLTIVIDALQSCQLDNGEISIDQYLRAFRELCRFFRLTGRLLGFVAADIQGKIETLEARRRLDPNNREQYVTFQSMVRFEANEGISRNKGRLASGTRTLLRLHWAFEFILEFIGRIGCSTGSTKISTLASKVYSETLCHHHPWLVQKISYMAMYMLPSRNSLIQKLCKQDTEAVLILAAKAGSVGQPVYNITQKLFEEYDLTYIK